MNRRQRTRTRGIDDAIRAVKVQLVRDPPRHDVPQQAGEAVFLPRHVRFADPRHHIVGNIFGYAGIVERTPPVRVAEPRAERHHEFERSRHAENDRHPRTIRHFAGTRLIRPGQRYAGIGQRLLRRHEAEELRSIGRFEVFRRHPEFERLEIDHRQEPAPTRVRHIGRLRVRIVIIVGVPVRRRHIRNAIDAMFDVRPIGTQPDRFREQATDAHDRNRCNRTRFDRVSSFFSHSHSGQLKSQIWLFSLFTHHSPLATTSTVVPTRTASTGPWGNSRRRGGRLADRAIAGVTRRTPHKASFAPPTRPRDSSATRGTFPSPTR